MITLKHTLGGGIIYRKVIVSGNVVEVYHYEKAPVNNFHLGDRDSRNGYEDVLNGLGEGEDFHEDRTEERRLQTVRDARNLTRRLALMNFKEGDKFLTLTFDPKKINDEKKLRCLNFLDAEFKKFIQRFNYRFKTKLNYIAVREPHRSGRLHFHMICNWDIELMGESHTRELERFVGEEVWKHGFVDIKAMDHVDNVGAYLIKYMGKNLSLDLYKGKKMYLPSRGLKRPLEYKGDSAEAVINFYDLDKQKEVFTNSYESEYLGTIVYKEFNLSRSV